MAKEEMINLDNIILENRNKTDLDEVFITNLASKSVKEAENELKEIDNRYDKRFTALSEEKKRRYHEHYSTLVEERKEIYLLLDKSQSEEERKLIFDHYLNMVAKIDSLFAVAEKEGKEEKEELIKMKQDDKKKAVAWKVVAAAAPIVGVAIWEGIKVLAKSIKK